MGVPRAAVEVREVGVGRGIRGPVAVVEDGMTRFPGIPNATPSLLRSVGVE